MSNISVCGIDCDISCVECNNMNEELKNNPCPGCNERQGKIFWTKYINLDVCPIYQCVQDKNLLNCGKCDKLPCDTWTNLKDPNTSEEAHKTNIQKRMETLKSMSAI